MATIINAVEVKGFVLRQKVVVPPVNGRIRTEHEAITSFLTTNADEFRELMKVYWSAGEDERIVEALPSGDTYSVPGIVIETVSLVGPDGKDATCYLSHEQKSVLGLAG